MIPTGVREPAAADAARQRILLACWLAWAAFVAYRYFIQLWRTLWYAPHDLLVLCRRAAVDVVVCVLIGSIAAGAAFALYRLWVRTRARYGPRSRAIAYVGAAAAVYPLFRWQPSGPVAAVDAVCAAALVILAAAAIGGPLVSAIGLRADRGEERAVFAVTVGFATLSTLLVSLAAVHAYRPWAILGTIVTCLLVGAASAWMRHEDGERPTAARIEHGATPNEFDRVWVAVAFVFGSFTLVAALAPEIEFDALWYHLYLPVRWLQAGRAVDLVHEYPSLYPLGFEMLFGASMVIGGVIAAKLLHASCLGALAVIVVAATRRWLPERSPYAAVALLVAMPTVIWDASTAYVDVALALYCAVAGYALARSVEDDERAWLRLSAIAFGGAAATKHLALVVLAVALPLAAVAMYRRGKKSWSVAQAAAFVALVTIVTALPWYWRAWWQSGNPFFPELYGWFGGGPPWRWDDLTESGLAAFKAHFGRGHTPAAVARLPWDITVHAADFGGTLGALPLLLVPACLIGRQRAPVVPILAIGLLGYVAVWASPISSLQFRFLIPAAAPIALLCAEGLHRLRSPLASAAVVLVAVLTLPPLIPLHETDRAGWNGWLTHVLRDAPFRVVLGRELPDAYLSRNVRSYGAWQWASRHLGAGELVLTFTGGDHLYSSVARIPHDGVAARSVVWTARTTGDVLAGLNAIGATHVLFDTRTLPDLQRQGLPIASDEFQQTCITVYVDRSFRLCRVGDAAVRPSPGR